ncbi:mitochondrial carrier domain-containing protein [Rhodocollybia butyracea]|uniref:Mitochondrial carrier domain-containing protein n=1 Tax=Rhodocollybia butyracea TaxID=206335 RepID=A0A9P5Q6J2_9AGAR|nr:mitochondrial carrier domain-containing protein [Rhodocollybia butyracea]
MTSTLPPLIQAISGSIGSACANTLTYPLDLVTTRVQLSSPETGKGKEKAFDSSAKTLAIHELRAIRILRTIVHSHGIGALYDGILTDTASTLVSNFLYFYIYSFLRKFAIRYLTGLRSSNISSSTSKSSPSKPIPSVKLTILQDLALGFLSGVASRAVSMPLSIITLRLQTERENEEINDENENRNDKLARAVRKIYQEQGLSGFWRGFNTTILLSLNPSITLAFFQLFRRILTLSRPRLPVQGKPAVLDPTPIEAFFSGAVSSSIAATLLYPLILSKTRLQASRSSSNISNAPPTLRTVMLDAYRGRYPHGASNKSSITGIKGLYQGLEMQILKGFFNQGVTFLVKGRIEQLIVQAYMRHKLGAGVPLPMPVFMPMESDDPNLSFGKWNIIEHVGRRYL